MEDSEGDGSATLKRIKWDDPTERSYPNDEFQDIWSPDFKLAVLWEYKRSIRKSLQVQSRN